ncbi:MAG: uncharacterized protein JWN04_1612 [Myxococcaceae bacterium]|nr:uncharacterized protein [Myxococcaceae bacterium]
MIGAEEWADHGGSAGRHVRADVAQLPDGERVVRSLGPSFLTVITRLIGPILAVVGMPMSWRASTRPACKQRQQRTRWCLFVACVLSLHGQVVHGQASNHKPHVRMAITIDDLPAAGSPVPGWSKSRILNTIADTLRQHQVPQPVGFFNGANMDDEPATKEAVEAWLRGGFLLGNHTFSHVSAAAAGAAAFEHDIARDQTVIVELEQHRSASSTYFRYPYLERGQGRDDRRIRRYLAQHKYRVADVSVDFEDWAFFGAYARCSAQSDTAALRALAESYLGYALSELFWSVDTTARLIGRALPQVLLVHANVMTAQMLDELLTEYEHAGVRFIPLREALDDGIYAQAQTHEHGDTTLVAALIRERHAHTRGSVLLPESLLDALCR